MRNRILFCLAFLLLLPVVARGQGFLEEEYHKNIKVFQPKPILKKERVDITPFGVMHLNPAEVNHYGAGVMLGYHINEYIWAGAQFAHMWSFLSQQDDEINEFTTAPRRRLGQLGTIRVAWTPLFSKGAFFGSFMSYWDFYLFGGGGVVSSWVSDRASNEYEFTGAGEFGIATRFYFTKWMSLVVELSDMMYLEGYKDETLFKQNFMLRVGLSFFVPPDFKYRNKK